MQYILHSLAYQVTQRQDVRREPHSLPVLRSQMSERLLLKDKGAGRVLGMLQTPRNSCHCGKPGTKPRIKNCRGNFCPIQWSEGSICRPWGLVGPVQGPVQMLTVGPALPYKAPKGGHSILVHLQAKGVGFILASSLCSSPGLPCGAGLSTGQLAAGLSKVLSDS